MPAREAGLIRIEYMPLSSRKAARRNPKQHALEDIKNSIRRFGYVMPAALNETSGCMVAGHGRTDALVEMKAAGEEPPKRILERDGEWFFPVLRGLDFDSEEEAEAYLVADNKLTELGGYDETVLAQVLQEQTKRLGDEVLRGLGISEVECARLLEALGGGGGGDPDHVPDAPAEPRTRPGDVWTLGVHRLMCGDSTSTKDVAQLLGDQRLVCIHADPPYGMGKEADGVANDNLYDEKLDAFQMRWWQVWMGVCLENASAYIWGNAPDLWRLWWKGGLGDYPKLFVRNELVWDKGSGFGMKSSDAHCFSPATERCLYLQCGQQFLGNQNKDDYWDGYEPLRSWMEEQRNKAGWTNADVNRITGSSMAGHWFTKSQFHPISAEGYAKLQKAAAGAAFVEGYDALFSRLFPAVRTEGNLYRRELSAQLRETRTYFDATHDAMTDVWNFSRVVGEERHGHATPKPVAMVVRAIKTSSRQGDAVGAPFSGTGPEIIAAEQLGRRCYAMELEPRYVDVAVARWEKFTGKTATKS